MMKKLMALMTVLLALSAPKAAQAFVDEFLPEGCPYVSAFGAANFAHVRRSHHHGSGSGSDVSSESFHNRLRTGYFFSGALGYRFCDGLRAEIEGGYHHNQRKSRSHGSDSDSGSRSRGGNANTWSVLVNGLYDFQTCWCLKPFLGVGIGYSSTDFKRRRHDNNNNSSSATSEICDTCGEGSDSSSSSDGHRSRRRKTGFAWQLIAGVAYPLCDGWDVSLQYRYFQSAVTRLHNNDVGIGLAYTF
jgi:opacity protein-like surface antigen